MIWSCAINIVLALLFDQIVATASESLLIAPFTSSADAGALVQIPTLPPV